MYGGAVPPAGELTLAMAASHGRLFRITPTDTAFMGGTTGGDAGLKNFRVWPLFEGEP